MPGYGRDYDRSRFSPHPAGQWRGGRSGGYIAQSRGFQEAPFRRRRSAGAGYAEEYHGRADRGQMPRVNAGAYQRNEEARFQRERAAPGEEMGWPDGDGYDYDREFGAAGRGYQQDRWGYRHRPGGYARGDYRPGMYGDQAGRSRRRYNFGW